MFFQGFPFVYLSFFQQTVNTGKKKSKMYYSLHGQNNINNSNATGVSI
jgi:hypothetical protein